MAPTSEFQHSAGPDDDGHRQCPCPRLLRGMGRRCEWRQLLTEWHRPGLGQTESLLVGRKRRGAVAQTAEGTAEEQTRQSRCECTGGDADSGFATEIFRYVGGDLRPRDADLRYGEGQEREGILYGEELVGRLWQLSWHLVSQQELRGDVHHLYLSEQARARQASVG